MVDANQYLFELGNNSGFILFWKSRGSDAHGHSDLRAQIKFMNQPIVVPYSTFRTIRVQCVKPLKAGIGV